MARLLSSRWANVAPLLALLLAACDDPPESTRRYCEDVMGVDVVCTERSGFRCYSWSCGISHIACEGDAGACPDAGADAGLVLEVDAGLHVPGPEARGLR